MNETEDKEPVSAEFMEALTAASEKGGQLSGASRPARRRMCEGAYALMTQRDLTVLAHHMPDTQSAVLACLGWQAALQQRLVLGPHAGKRLARISTATLAEMTGKPLRSIKWALAKLKADGLIKGEESRSGRTAVYRVAALGKGDRSFIPSPSWRRPSTDQL